MRNHKPSNSFEDVALGFGTHGAAHKRGEHAGLHSTASALRQRDLIDGEEPTDAGRKALVEAGFTETRI